MMFMLGLSLQPPPRHNKIGANSSSSDWHEIVRRLVTGLMFYVLAKKCNALITDHSLMKYRVGCRHAFLVDFPVTIDISVPMQVIVWNVSSPKYNTTQYCIKFCNAHNICQLGESEARQSLVAHGTVKFSYLLTCKKLSYRRETARQLRMSI